MADRPPMLGNQMRPDVDGRFGKFGGKYVPETLIPALEELNEEYSAAMRMRFDPGVPSTIDILIRCVG